MTTRIDEFGCFTGDCPHDSLSECFDALKYEWIAQAERIEQLEQERNRLIEQMREDGVCLCGWRQRMVGDGCYICNPDMGAGG